MSRSQTTIAIAIVGGGIAGLTAALCLARVGLRSTIFERADELSEVGAGLQLSPNALSVMELLGLLPALQRAGTEASHVELKRGLSGRTITEVPVHAGDGTPYLSIHRADLQTVLRDAVEREPKITLRLGATLASVRPGAGSVKIGLANGGDTITADLLIAADGVRSAVAEILGLAPAVPTGTTAWRTTIEAAEAADPFDDGAGIRAWLGPRRHAVAYPIRAGRAVNLVMIAQTDESPNAARNLSAGFSNWDEQLVDLARRASAPTPWPLFATPVSRPFVLSDGRIVLLGDAAHAMAPYAAQGAGMAIEDAAVLADALARTGEPRAAAELYEAERRPRIDRVRKRVGFHRFVYHLAPPLSLGRDMVLALRPKAALRGDLAWLYDWRAPDLTHGHQDGSGPQPSGRTERRAASDRLP
ncbi:FAD-dependent monooxygenase [Jiella pelagia]|uniref:FAD-dependent monooxygenase n=1 Tax=Jiella pelagia TaxID=2986949 RepID=A0ABY7BUX4_9HYPH|nr:FAD-dependent monooxygenase [Jiella pelagia]WAP67269.1 FAD-dependent monooxygenase [Jiella pelagia]